MKRMNDAVFLEATTEGVSILRAVEVRSGHVFMLVEGGGIDFSFRLQDDEADEIAEALHTAASYLREQRT